MTDRRGLAGTGRPTPRMVRVAQVVARIRSDVPLAVLDVALVVAAYVGVLLLRFDGDVPAVWWQRLQLFLPASIGVHLLAHWLCGLYGQMWRHASVQEARRVVLAGAGSGVTLAVLFLLARRLMPLSVVVLGAVVATMLVGALRFQSRLFAFRRGSPHATRVVILGAGKAGAAIVRELRRVSDADLLPVAFLDDDPRKQGRRLLGIRVIGGLDALAETVERHHAEQALLAMPSADSELVRRVANAADGAGITLKVLPPVTELINGQVSVRDVRDLEISDLLGRQQVETDLDAVRAILGDRVVLITGAGGSIGSEITRQVAACEPARLVLLDHDETHLFEAAASIGDRCDQVLADIRDPDVIHAVVAQHRPQVIFHAAAHKHVPLLETHPCEAVATNIAGTNNLIDAAIRCGVERFVFISTDKAVEPSSVMGASKAVGEQLLLAAAPAGTRYCAVRFGNVLGSRGSVVPTFMRQIRDGGPVTITDPRMTRFFMSIQEAVQLVLQAAALSAGGEIFMLDMGQPVRIMDLAERMIRLSGRRVGLDVSLRITGVRAGEKLAEQLRAPYEAPAPTLHPAIVSLRPQPCDRQQLAAAVSRLVTLGRLREATAVVNGLFDLVGAHRTVDRVIVLEPEPVASRNGGAGVAAQPPVRTEVAWNRSTT